MFSFLKKIFKKAPLELTVHIEQSKAYLLEILPPRPAKTFVPSWYKNLQKFVTAKNTVGLEHPSPTMKTCPVIFETLHKGFVIPLWSDLYLEVNHDGNYRYEFCSRGNHLNSHDREQLGNQFYPGFINIKLLSPWAIRTNKFKKFYLSSAFYHLNTKLDFLIMPGFIDFYYNKAVHINILVPIPKQGISRIHIKAGTPLVQLIDTTMESFIMNYRIVSSDEFISLTNYRISHEFGTYKFKKFKNHLDKDL